MPWFTCVLDWNVIKSRFLDVKGPLERFVEFPRLLWMAAGRPFVQSKYLGRWRFQFESLSTSHNSLEGDNNNSRSIPCLIKGLFDFLPSEKLRRKDVYMTFLFSGLFIHVSLHDVDVPNAHNSQSYLPYTHTHHASENGSNEEEKNLKSNDDDMHLFIKESCWRVRGWFHHPRVKKVFFFSIHFLCRFLLTRDANKKASLLYKYKMDERESGSQHTSRVLPSIYY
jgi:hypothetical protein